MCHSLHTPTPCADCGAKPKPRQNAFTRHSPDAITATEYLSANTEFSVEILPTDIICKPCYNMHIAILNHIDCQSPAHISLQSPYYRLIIGYARNPSLKQQLYTCAILGFALSEDMGLLCVMMTFLFVLNSILAPLLMLLPVVNTIIGTV